MMIHKQHIHTLKRSS